MRKLAVYLVFCCAIALVASCGAKPPKPVSTKAKIVASADVNPDRSGRPSPVHIRIFQLKEASAFLNASYDSLDTAEQATLGATLVTRREETLDVGQQKEFELKIDPEARVLAVMAEFANYRNTNGQWRVAKATPGKSLMDLIKKDRVLIGVEKDRVTLEVGD